MIPCIYAILNTKTQKRYVGSAVNLKVRWANHRVRLNKSTHHSIKLQNSWNMHGAKAFTVEVLELVPDKDLLLSGEQYWIDLYEGAKIGYNINPIAGSSRGIARGPRSDEVKAKISAAQKGRALSESHKAALKAAHVGMTGKKQSKEFCNRMSKVHSGKTISKESIEKSKATRAKNWAEKNKDAIDKFTATLEG